MLVLPSSSYSEIEGISEKAVPNPNRSHSWFLQAMPRLPQWGSLLGYSIGSMHRYHRSEYLVEVYWVVRRALVAATRAPAVLLAGPFELSRSVSKRDI